MVESSVEQETAQSDTVEVVAVEVVGGDDTSALKSEIADLQREVERLTEERDRLVLTSGQVGGDGRRDDCEEAIDDVYVLAEDTDEARAFDRFYSAYDEVHAKTREFLLG